MAAKNVRKRVLLILLILALIAIAFFAIKYGADKLYRSAYPQDYSELVTKYAQEFSIDENILYAIIKTESDFKPNATSNVGARGLMQMMNNTFLWIQTKLKDNDTVYDDMYNPDENIRYGAFLISYLYNEFESYDVAIAGYHAGRTAVASWLKDKSYSNDGITLDNIPSSDTAHYVSKVLKNYDIYNKLYN